jgi:hypothetical protein
MAKWLRWLSLALLVAALAAVICLLAFDGVNRLTMTFLHQQAGAWALIFIGASYICLQMAIRQPTRARVKGVLLGVAFGLWGTEQFLPPGPLVTAMDSAVVTIFVVDLGLIVADQLRKGDDA